MKHDGWTKILPLMPQRDPAFLTCGGVWDLNTEEWEKDRLRDWRSRRPGPKVGEAGSDEQRYATALLKRKR